MGAVTIVAVAWIGRENYRPVITGELAPAFTVATVEGAPVSLADYAGKVVLLNVWATWCPPCLDEMPSMQRLYEELDDESFEIVAISIDARLGETDT